MRLYTSALRDYVRWLGPVHPRAASSEQVRALLVHLFDRGVSRSRVDQAISALKFLSRADVRRLAQAIPNPKDRLVVLLMYAPGLRVAELAHVRVAGVDLDRRTLHVRGGKGRKDRIRVLSERLLDPLAAGPVGPREDRDDHLSPL